jgi:hypothetical protein
MMRRIIPALLVVIFLASLYNLAVSARSTETDAAITAAYGTPVIDGEPDDVWQTTEVQNVLKVDDQVIPSETKTTGTVRVLWDENYLYFFITVDKHGVVISSGGGNNENTDDCADVCFTMNGNFEGENNVTGGDEYAGVFRTILDGTFSGFGDFVISNMDDFKGVMKQTSDTTYNSEYAIPWTDIKPAPGYVMSMDIQINDATDGTRTGLVNWAYVPCFGWRDSKYHGMVTLLAPVEPEPPAEEAPVTETPDAGDTGETAPATGDIAVISAALVLITCATVLTLAKRKH